MLTFKEFLTEGKRDLSRLRDPYTSASSKKTTISQRAKRSIEARARKAAQSGSFVRPIPGGYQIINPKTKKVRTITAGRSQTYLKPRINRDKPSGKWTRGEKQKKREQQIKAPLKRRQRLRPVQAYAPRYKRN